MSAVEERPSNCQYCGYDCAVIATVEDGRVTGLRPDPARYPYGSQVMAACRRWPMNVAALDAPDRVNWPLRRVGERGSGKWERVSWEVALDDIAERLAALAAESGPETLASAIGGPHASFWPLHRFMNLFGSPNNMGIGQICWNPRVWMDMATFGWSVEADIVPGLTECLVLWGTNPAQSDNSAFWQHIRAYAAGGGALVVVDPRRTEAAAIADVWLPVRPGTDAVLALGLLNVIIGEELYDASFVDAWCSGFDELARAVAPLAPEAVAVTCGVSADDIRRAARLFSGGRASALVSGRGIDQIGAAVAPTHRALCCLRAITGNVDKPGACVLAEAPDFVSELAMEMSDAMPASCRAAALSSYRTPLQSYAGYDALRALTERLGRTPPMRYLTSAHPDLVLRAMEEGRPYPIRALVVQATNPLLTYGDTARVRRALSALDLLVVLEYRLTPTTCCPSPARWSARFCRCTAASPTPPTEGRRLWLPTTSAGATTTCSASWDVVWGRPSSGPRRRSRTRLRRSFYLQGFPGRSSASRAPTGPGPPTRSMRRTERMGVRSDSPRRRAESSSQASFCLSTAAAACPSPCLGVPRLLAAPSHSSPALADSRIMLPCTSRIRAFVMGRQHRRQR